MTSLQRRIRKLEATKGAMMQANDRKPEDLSMLSRAELEVLKKVLHYTLAREAATPTGKRLAADPSGLSADDMVVYLRTETLVRDNGAALKARTA